MAIKPLSKPGGVFEISDRVNQSQEALYYLTHVTRMYGFNNFYFDWQVLRYLINNPLITPYELYEIADRIINGDRDENFRNTDWNPSIEQVDLFLINHFNNKARRCSLKQLEFVMRSKTIEDLPFPPGTWLTNEQKNITIEYNLHDLNETEKFVMKCMKAIEFRESLGGGKILNFNDGKIGKKRFTDELERVNPGCTKQQTKRPGGVNIGDILLPNITYQFCPNLKRNLEWIKKQTIPEHGGKLATCVNGIDIGLGGIHGSLHKTIIKRDDLHTVLDLDVTSYYPSIAIVNGFYPEHLGPEFCRIYQELKTERLKHPKGTLENAALKLALNVPYGESNNIYGPFLDYKYLLSITLNGQLQLTMLMEQLLHRVPYCQLVQINTDGLTIRFPTKHREIVNSVSDWWQKHTGYDLEDVEYNRMFIRDVNNYIAESVDGKIKRKGAYEYENLDYSKDHSFLVVPKAVEAYFLHGTPIQDFIRNHEDVYDFLGMVRVNRNSRLETETGEKLQNIIRYYASLHGDKIYKYMPPLANSKTRGDRKIGIEVGWNLSVCNEFDGKLINLNEDFYIEKANRLIF